MNFIPAKLPEVIIVQPAVQGDARGYFMETWHKQKFAEGGIKTEFVQDNHSQSARNTLRGLHYQIKQPQGKLVRVIAGEVFDVAVDMRKSSLTFGQWVGVSLSAENMKMLWVPPGFAHGFLVVSEQAEVVYKCTDYYAPEYERTIAWNDRDLNIAWPLLQNRKPLLSKKDAEGISFKDAEVYP